MEPLYYSLSTYFVQVAYSSIIDRGRDQYVHKESFL